MEIILIITTLFSGLIAGLFYSWQISVTPGLAKLNEENYLIAFQSMNRAIINPYFLIVFMGLIVLLITVTFQYETSTSIQFWFTTSAIIIYITGVIAVTFIGNIPLNNGLDALTIETMSSEEMISFRQSFENEWNRLNMVRTISSSLTFLLMILSCFYTQVNL